MPKKSKNIKKTDIKGQKPWLKKTMGSRFLIEEVSTNKSILIVTEGQTEELYFKSFPVLALNVITVNLKGQSKTKLIESTRSIIDDSEVTYDEVWCVFDMDVKQGEEEFSDFDNGINKGIQRGFNVAFSNDSFELWFYLHFEYNEQSNHRTFYYQQLGNLWDLNYEKLGKKYAFCKSIYQNLEQDDRANQELAIKRAKKLDKLNKEEVYHKKNPTTMVYELVEVLNQNLRP